MKIYLYNRYSHKIWLMQEAFVVSNHGAALQKLGYMNVPLCAWQMTIGDGNVWRPAVCPVWLVMYNGCDVRDLELGDVNISADNWKLGETFYLKQEKEWIKSSEEYANRV